jgi:TetR/AcrR family transcriptional repressor of nem operon
MRKPTETKNTLMETAIDLVWQSNYSSVGVAEICKQAGVTKGSFYHYFETKADLFYEASQHYWSMVEQQLDEVFSPRYTPLIQLENLFTFIITKQEMKEEIGGNPVSGCPFFTAGGQACVGEEKVRQAAMEMAAKVAVYNTALVRGLKGDGVLNSDPDPAQVGRMIHHYVMGLLIYGQVARSLDVVKQDLREAIYRIVDLKHELRKPNII